MTPPKSRTLPKITRDRLSRSPMLLRLPFALLSPRFQKWVARALRVRAEPPATAWNVWRALLRRDPAHALEYPRWTDPVPGRGYDCGGQPAAALPPALLAAWRAARVFGTNNRRWKPWLVVGSRRRAASS